MFHIFSQPLFRKSEVRRSDRRRSTFAPVLDGLERRELLTTVQLSGIAVLIVPTANQDNNVSVSVAANKVDVNVNGQDWFFDKSAVLAIQYDASATVAGTHQTFINNTAIGGVEFGGKGTNVFTTGHSFDTVIGFGGDNTVNARDGYTTYIGCPGSTATFNAGTGEGVVMTIGASVSVNGNTAGKYHVWAM